MENKSAKTGCFYSNCSNKLLFVSIRLPIPRGAHASTSRRQVVHIMVEAPTPFLSTPTIPRDGKRTDTHTHTHTRSVSLAFFHGAITLCFRSGYASTREKRFLDRINIEITARVTRHTVAATPVASRDSYLRIYRPRAEVERPRRIRAEEGG